MGHKLTKPTAVVYSGRELQRLDPKVLGKRSYNVTNTMTRQSSSEKKEFGNGHL